MSSFSGSWEDYIEGAASGGPGTVRCHSLCSMNSACLPPPRTPKRKQARPGPSTAFKGVWADKPAAKLGPERAG
jgi:hypothetical protein